MSLSLERDSFPRNEARVIPRKYIRRFAYRQACRGKNSASSLLEFRSRGKEGRSEGWSTIKETICWAKRNRDFKGQWERKGEGVRACVCVCVYQEEIPVFFEIKARGGNIELEKLVSIVFMSYIYIYICIECNSKLRSFVR